MAKAILINEDREFERDYQICGNTIIILKLEDDFSEIKFYDSSNMKLDGEFEFKDEDENGESYLSKRMYVPGTWKNSGLGRAALEFFKDYTDPTIYAREDNGKVRDDGSHLTEEAPGFIKKMIEEGLIMDKMRDMEYGYYK